MKKSNFLFFIVVSLILTCGFTAMKLIKDPWLVPSNYKTLKNKVVSSKGSIAEGKELYDMACASCHGTSGNAKASKGIELYDLSSPTFHAKYSDGEIYYQSFIGRLPWHNFTKAVPDETDRWNVVNYIRSLKTK